MNFELFPINANQTGGRLISIVSQGGQTMLQFAYATSANDTTASAPAFWQKSSATDLNGNTLQFNWSTLACGVSAISSVATPTGTSITYTYDSSGNLNAVTLPNGDVSTITRTGTSSALKITYSEASATGTHRNKTALYSNNIAAALLAWDNNQRPAIYNQASELVRVVSNGTNEVTWYSLPDPNTPAHRKVYEGAGRLRFIDVAEKSAYTTWALPSGFSGTSTFASISSTKETYGMVSPYYQYAQNRSGTPAQTTVPESPTHLYTYDANGNLTTEKIGSKTRWIASDMRFNKPILDVDFSGRAVVRSYDNSGNLVSQKKGWVLDGALGAGAEISGVSCAFYTSLPTTSFAAIDSATPNSIIGVQGIASCYRSPEAGNSAMRFTGKLVLATAGVRTFYMKAANSHTRLTVDGGYYTRSASQGETSIALNLSSGVHDIKWETIGGVSDFSLAWSGPETLVNGVAVKSAIDTSYLKHLTTAGELAVRPTSVVSEEKWEYFPAGDSLAGLMQSYTDGSGKRTEYAYDSNRRVIQVSETGDSGSLVVTQVLTYDVAGNQISKADAVGRTVNYAYDSRNRLIKTAYGDGTTETSLYGTGVNANLIVQTKDRNGSVTKTDYDASGRAVTITRGYALADNDGNITQVLPNPSVETDTYLHGTTDVLTRALNGKVTQYDYDYKGRVTSTTTFPVQGKSLVQQSTFISSNEQPQYTTDAYGRRTFFAYRNFDRITLRQIQELVPGSLGSGLTSDAAILAVTRDASANPGYIITDITPDLDGRTVAQSDAKGVITATAYDAAARVAAVTKAAGLPEQAVTTIAYDGAGHVVSQTDALNRTTTRAYTPAGRVASVTYPDNTTENFTYFADGKLATRKDTDGFVRNQFWSNCCGRDMAAANPQDQGTVKFYDGAGHVTFAATVNNLSSVIGFGPNLPSASVVSAQTSQFDARGRLTATTKWLVAPASVDPKNPPIATDPTQGLTTTYAYYDNLSDARFATVLSQLATKGVALISGSATVVTSPTGEASFTVSDGAGLTVASGVFNK